MFPRCWAILTLSLCLGCASTTTRVDTHNDAEVTVSFDYRDIDGAATQLAKSLLASQRLGNGKGKTPVVAFGRVVNDTCQHLDTDLITAKIGEALLASGRFSVSSVFADRASGRDATVSDVRAVRGNTEFDAASIQAKGQLKAPDISIAGKLTQRNVRRDDGGLRIEYFLTLRATRLSDGTAVWQDSCQTVKAVASEMPVW